MNSVELMDLRNSVRAAMFAKGLTEAQGMDALQDVGVISDLCVWLESVHVEDLERARDFFLMEYEASDTV